MRSAFFILILAFPAQFSQAQVVKSVVLDSVMIQAVKKGFDVSDFIDMVRSDTSFLEGFRSLHNNRHTSLGEMTIYGKKKKVHAVRYQDAIQEIKNERRWMVMNSERVEGKFYKRNEEPGTYTAELFDELFFYDDTLSLLNSSMTLSKEEGTESIGNINKLKTLVFNPGAEIDGVPIVGKRLAIFDDDMVRYYDYSITSRPYQDTVSCYVFSCIAKPGSGDYPVLKSLNTWFDKKTFNIVYRDYHYQYRGLLFEFDVSMKVTMSYDRNVLYPSKINYSGYWDIPMKKQETVDFELNFKLLEER
ncbi:MAG: hypothetical protein M3Q95_14140 [Bacteroidota bacterium]|nr:hypothetical protein [Bacteroidota bacterium]